MIGSFSSKYILHFKWLFWIFFTDYKMIWFYHCARATDTHLELRGGPVTLRRLQVYQGGPDWCPRLLSSIPLGETSDSAIFLIIHYPESSCLSFWAQQLQGALCESPSDEFIGWLACVFLLLVGLLERFCLFNRWFEASWKRLELLWRLNRARDDVVCMTWAVSLDCSQRAMCLTECSVNTALKYSVHFG